VHPAEFSVTFPFPRILADGSRRPWQAGDKVRAVTHARTVVELTVVSATADRRGWWTYVVRDDSSTPICCGDIHHWVVPNECCPVDVRINDGVMYWRTPETTFEVELTPPLVELGMADFAGVGGLWSGTVSAEPIGATDFAGVGGLWSGSTDEPLILPFEGAAVGGIWSGEQRPALDFADAAGVGGSWSGSASIIVELGAVCGLWRGTASTTILDTAVVTGDTAAVNGLWSGNASTTILDVAAITGDTAAVSGLWSGTYA